MFKGALEPHSTTAGTLIKELNTCQLKRVNQIPHRPLIGFPRLALDLGNRGPADQGRPG